MNHYKIIIIEDSTHKGNREKGQLENILGKEWEVKVFNLDNSEFPNIMQYDPDVIFLDLINQSKNYEERHSDSISILEGISKSKDFGKTLIIIESVGDIPPQIDALYKLFPKNIMKLQAFATRQWANYACEWVQRRKLDSV